MSYYCDYCGYGYLERTCRICGLSINTCGCDFLRDVCEEHYCQECDVAYADEDMNEDGVCINCREEGKD